MGRKLVSHCGEAGCVGRRDCGACRRIYMRGYRARGGGARVGEQESRGEARLKANHLVRNGTIKRELCAVCGSDAEMHHPDYSKPDEVVWLCRAHHMEQHPDAMRRGGRKPYKLIRAIDLPPRLGRCSYHGCGKPGVRAFGDGARCAEH